jgi:hypothetical protein
LRPIPAVSFGQRRAPDAAAPKADRSAAGDLQIDDVNALADETLR